MANTADSATIAGTSNSQYKGYQNDTLSPYFLHPNENPNHAVVNPLPSGSNYHSWSRAMIMALKSKNKIRFINGSLPKPDDEDQDSLAWDRCNTMIMSWINNSIEAEISRSVLWMDSAYEVWVDLKDRFYQGDIFRISDLQEEIYSLKQGAVRGQIMPMDPLPKISKVYSLLVLQERQTATPLDESKILVVSGGYSGSSGRGYSNNGRGNGRNNRGGSINNGGRGSGRNNKLCTHCGQTNHIVDDCWKKYGYPPHMQHLQTPRTANNCVNTNGEDGDTQQLNCDEDNVDSETGKYSLTASQYKAFLALLQGSNTLSSHSINHVTTQTGILCTIPHSNNSEHFILDTVSTCFAGTVQFDQNLNLTDENASKKMIGVAEILNGLYILKTPTKRLSFPLSTSISANAFDLVHMDIWGPLSIPSMLGFKYFLTIVDDKTRFTWIYFMKLKSEASIHIKSFHAMIHTQFHTKIKCIRTDNGSEFLLKDFYAEHGILHQSSCVATPQQNGIVERKHQHILGTARALLFQSHLPKFFWAHAVGHAVHIINRLPTPFLSQKSPYQMLYNCLPDITTLKVFGSLAYASTLSSHRHKLDSRSRKYVTLGFKTGVKGHILFDLLSKEIFISRDVIFFEHSFPYASLLSNGHPHSTPSTTHNHILFDDLDYTPPSNPPITPPTDHHIDNSSHPPDIIPTSSLYNDHSLSPSTSSNSTTSPSHNAPAITIPINDNSIRKSTRISHPPSYLQDYHCNLKNNTIHCISQFAPSSYQFERHKARLVAKGFTQTEGIDYTDTFSPVVKMTTVRTFMAIAASQHWPLYQLDLNTTFLHGDLNEEVYMKPPPGLPLSHPDFVCKLQRSLYGLKQASRQWNVKLTETLTSTGYIQSKADYSLFTKQSTSGFIAILVYVGDLVLGGTDTNEIHQLKSLLDTKFSIKDLARSFRASEEVLRGERKKHSLKLAYIFRRSKK
ncbi:hypothetical protein TSUD_159950 [Trifolium subterraneum]|uniref:Integrase catalytic domain-containing protein n=1 Tax=Trifolium subterraneum TaxID=3900 RepID=A0A2Z6M7J8_TRISU|nr:hypothetical protein TSUD_159950 [Trifolium subterraneum]